jgi:Cu/Ag efflux protein CusF
MKTPLVLLLLSAALLLSACGKKADCGCADACKCETCDCATKSASPGVSSGVSTDARDSAAPKKHPLKGVITDVLADQSALTVKHEEIPGFMKAMTMMLTVDPAVLSTVKKGDPITGLLYRDAGGTWRLDEVKTLPDPVR